MLNSFLRIQYVFTCVLLLSCSAPASDVDLMDRLKAARADLEYKIIGPSEIPGFMELQIGDDPNFYVSSDGKFLFDGDVYLVGEGDFSNVKEFKLNDARKQAITGLDLEDLIVFEAQGQKKATINVFTDIDCGFCRKLHKEVPSLNKLGIEVRYLAFPRAGVGSKSYQKAVTAWCADNPLTALTEYKNGVDKQIRECDKNPVAEQYQLGQTLGINGTPAIILDDGTLVPGYRTADAIAKILGLSS